MTFSEDRNIRINREWRRKLKIGGTGVAVVSGGALAAALGVSGAAQAVSSPPTTEVPASLPLNSGSSSISAGSLSGSGQGDPFPSRAPRMSMIPESVLGRSAAQSAGILPFAQEQNDNLYVFWNFNGNYFTTLKELVYPKALAPSTFWAMSWLWNGSQYGGYEGLQTDAGGNANQAIFSLWQGASAAPGTGARCQQFNEGGTGQQCFLPFAFDTSHTYEFDLSKTGGDGHGGYDWRGSIYDATAGVSHKIGLIDVPAGDAAATNPPLNFSEYFGSPFTCHASPVSWIQWTPPAATNPNGPFGAVYNGYHYGGDSCSNYAVSSGSYGSQPYINARLGG